MVMTFCQMVMTGCQMVMTFCQMVMTFCQMVMTRCQMVMTSLWTTPGNQADARRCRMVMTERQAGLDGRAPAVDQFMGLSLASF